MSTEFTTEAAVVADLAAASANRVETVNPDSFEVTSTVLRSGEVRTVDSLERFLEVPRRQRASYKVIDVGGFVHLVGRFSGSDSIIFADQTADRATAVFNCDDGWRDHRAVLQLEQAPEWAHWTGRNGVLMNQVQFAEHIEDGIAAIASPSPADLMEIAATFQAKRSLSFESGTRLRSGDVKFVFHEETKAGAGVKGDLEIPEFILLRLPVYRNGGSVEIGARLRYRILPEGLKLGYKLEKLHDVQALAFDAVTTEIVDKVDVAVVHGYAPDVVAPL